MTCGAACALEPVPPTCAVKQCTDLVRPRRPARPPHTRLPHRARRPDGAARRGGHRWRRRSTGRRRVRRRRWSAPRCRSQRRSRCAAPRASCWTRPMASWAPTASLPMRYRPSPRPPRASPTQRRWRVGGGWLKGPLGAAMAQRVPGGGRSWWWRRRASARPRAPRSPSAPPTLAAGAPGTPYQK